MWSIFEFDTSFIMSGDIQLATLYISIESVKLHALRAKNVLACQCALRAYVLTCLRALRAYTLTYLRALRASVLTCQRVLRAYVLTSKRAILNNVNSCIIQI